MANRKLNSIKFPDIADTYILDADKVNYDDSETYASGSVGKALQNKANIDGSYEDLTAGTANQINTSVRANDKTPYIFRTSGGSVDIGDREYVNGIVGGTVAWNQLYNPNSSQIGTDKGLTLTKDTANGTWTLNGTTTAQGNAFGMGVVNVQNHIYYIADNSNQPNTNIHLSSQSFGQDSGSGKIIKNTSANATWYYVFNVSVEIGTQISGLVLRPMVIDLTQMFGSTIADYIYSLETATAGAGVAFFKSLFPKPYYAYNAGELKSVKGLVSHDMVGFNAFDLTSGKAKVVGGHQYEIVGTYTSLSLDGETITPSSGKFTPSKNGELTVVGGNSTTCVHLVWDNSRNGEYEPYVKHSYPLDSDLTLRGIPKLDANNNLYYDGDVYEADGTVTRKYGIRAYQSGDESLADAITDGTNTVYKLTTPTTETADAYQHIEIVNDFGTEEFVIDSDIAVPIPVGTDTDYPVNLVAKLEMAPNSPEGNGDYIVRQTNGMNEYVSLSGSATIQDIISRLEALENA